MSQQLVYQARINPVHGPTGQPDRVPERAKRMTADDRVLARAARDHRRRVRRNLPPPTLYEEAIRHDPSTRIADSGALVAYSGEKTGRSPKDKRIVRRPDSEGDVWWGPVNIPL